MPNLNDICLNIIENNQQVTAAGIIEHESALLLGFASEHEDNSLDYFETLAAAIVNMYYGRNIKTVESLITALSGVTAEKSVKNIHLIMNNYNIFVATLSGDRDMFLFVVVNPGSDIDDAWNIVHTNTKAISNNGL